MKAKRSLAASVASALLVAVMPVLTNTAHAAAPYTIDAGQLRITLDGTGVVTSLVNKTSGHEYASSAHQQSLIQIVANGTQQLPTALSYDSATSTYDFAFGSVGVDVKIVATAKSGYTTFAVTALTEPQNVDVSALMWGPIATAITKTVGEEAGVVYDSDFAIGIHELNDKTIGGWIQEYDNLTYNDSTYTSPMAFEWHSASRTSWGSILQAYTYDHSVPRVRNATWMPNQPHAALTGTDGPIVGSKIALFGAATASTLDTISTIQTGEGLLHPTVGGVWDKKSQASRQTFFVLNDLNTNNVATVSQYANAAGINYLYALVGANGPWVTNGHFQFNSSFGGSDSAATTMASTAANYGVKVGVHTLSDFIDPGDAYTTPVPNPGLVSGGTATLTRPLDSSSTSIYVSVDAPFRNSFDQYVTIGSEIATYSTITQISSSEWMLSGGSRHIWSTTAASYASGVTVSRLIGNEYGGAVGGLPVIDEIATRLASIFNNTGIKAMSFDGLESASQAGYGTYSTNRLVNGMYRQLSSTSDFISEASNLTAGTWDAQTRVSWGEEGSTSWAQRYNNMAFCVHNFMPTMIGWLSLPGTLPEVEYRLSKMAAWNAGTGFQTSVSTLNSMANRSAILSAIKLWEQVRNLGAFTPGQQAAMMDLSTYWHLTEVTAGSRWNLQQTDSSGASIGTAQAVFVGNTDPSSEPNLALTASASASSEYDGRYLAGNAIDGVTNQDGYGEWASHGEVNPWLRLDWNSNQTVGRVVLYDRPNLGDWVQGGTLTFSDGSSVAVAGVPNDGTPYTVTFAPRSVNWIKFQIKGTGSNVGLSEMKVFAQQNLARLATASASSAYDSRYVAANAIDGITGQWGTGEWASSHELNPWLRLDWAGATTVNQIVFYDRNNLSDWAPGGTLTFSDGSTVSVSGIPNDGSPYSVTFPNRTVTWVKFQISGGSGSNVGLSEMQVYSQESLAASATASASSIYDSRYVAANVLDGSTASEWASHGELNPWLQLDWTTSKTISGIVFNDRPNTGDWAPGGTLTFSDGSSVTVSGIPNDGSAYTVTFPSRTVTWVKFQVSGGSGYNVGLAEFEPY